MNIGQGPPRGRVMATGRDGLHRRRMLALGGGALAGAALAGCGRIITPIGSRASSSGAASGNPPAGAGDTAAVSTAGGGEVWLYLSILTGGMIGKKGWPEFVPADFRVPANAMVHCEIRCFDDGPADVPSGYEKVKGTVDGSITVISAVNGDLSGAKSQTVQAVDPKNVAHTLTVADTGLNIPIPPLSTVRFTFQSGAAGTHGWQCMAACGTGQGGWGGPMATGGWMQGTMTVGA